MNNIKDFIYYNKSYIIVGILLLLITIFGFLIGQKIINNNNNNNDNDITQKIDEKKLVLFGSDNITLNYKEKYYEPGFYAINEEGELETEKVIVEGTVDIEKSGTYTITYQYDNIFKKRTIKVLDKEEKNDDNNNTNIDNNDDKKEEEEYDINLLTISLKGEQTIRLYSNQKYQEPGYIAKYNNIDLTNKVVVTSNYIEGQVGNYTKTYTIYYNGLKKQVTRGIVVISNNLDISLKASTTSYTNSTVTITVSVTGNGFSYLYLPNNNKSQNKTSTYTVTRNGTYTFTAYSTSNQVFTKSITINNIDKESPTGTCEATINTNNTVIKVNAKDNLSGIKNYIYKNSGNTLTTSTSNTYTYNAKTSKNVSVQVIDKVSNSTNLTCKIIDNSYLPVIKPNTNENIIKQSETNSLKVYITKKSDYYITRVWMIDPYNQVNKQDSPNYGNVLYKPSVLMQNAINVNNLQNKVVVGFNASGFYLKDTYDKDSVNKYSGYDKTSVGTLVITNGKVVRNVYDKAYKTWFVAGIDSNNTLRIFTDEKSTDVNAKKAWSQSVINSKIRNTFTFASPLVENGQKSTITTNMPSYSSKKSRQAICQVNQNNFVLITGKNLSRDNLISIMLDLKCQTGTNLDGGGSIALLYKAGNSQAIETIIGNGRELPEVGYFKEN